MFPFYRVIEFAFICLFSSNSSSGTVVHYRASIKWKASTFIGVLISWRQDWRIISITFLAGSKLHENRTGSNIEYCKLHRPADMPTFAPKVPISFKSSCLLMYAFTMAVQGTMFIRWLIILFSKTGAVWLKRIIKQFPQFIVLHELVCH
jgi:hypothetical protein